MINTGFIHSYDDSYIIESAYNQDMSDINSIMTDFITVGIRKNDMEKLGIITESYEEYFEESVAIAIENLGKKIIEIVERIRDFIKEKVDKVKTAIFNKKDTDQKIREIEKTRPDIAERIKVAVNANELSLTDIKDISQFYKDIDDTLDEIEKGRVDPSSLKGKIQAAKDKLNKSGGGIKVAAGILGLAVSGTALVLNIQKIKKAKLDKLEKCPEDIANHAAESAKRLEKVNRVLKDKVLDPAAKAQYFGVLAQASAEVDAVTKEHVSKYQKAKMKIIGAVDSVVQKAYTITRQETKLDNKRAAKIAGIMKENKAEISRLRKVSANARDTATARAKLSGNITGTQ